MQTTEITVCNIGLFGNSVRHFWLNELSGILEKFPALEFPHKQDFYTLIILEEAQGEIVIDNQKIRLDRAKAIIIKPSCINSIDITRKAKGTIICFTEDFSLYDTTTTFCISFLFCKEKQNHTLGYRMSKNQNGIL